MEKTRKLEAVRGIIDALGLSPEDVVSYFSELGQLNGNTAEVLAKQDETAKKVLPGMYVYADGLISPEIIQGRQIKAVVGYVDGSEVLAVCLREKILPWSSAGLKVPETKKMDSGKEATAKILEAAAKENLPAEAAEYCYKYAEDGVKQGEAFLPSRMELEKLCFAKDKINMSLNKLGLLELCSAYWSSAEYSSNGAWYVYFYNGDFGHIRKCSSYSVRPVISFKI